MHTNLAGTIQIPQINRRIDWRGLGWAYLFFWYFSGIHHLLLQLSGNTTFVGFRLAAIASLLWLIPLLIFPQRTRHITAAIGVILWAFSLISLGYFWIYGQEFSQSVIFIIFESNTAEASEYVAQYFNWWMLPATVAYSAGAYFLWRKLRPIHMTRWQAWLIIALIVCAIFGYPQLKQLRGLQFSSPVAAERIQKNMEPAVPWQIFVGYAQYRKQLEAMQDLLKKNNQIPPLANLSDANAGLPATLVLVLGESTNRQHMSLYGYSRQTTPQLDAMRNELFIFNQVVASRPYTIETLQQVLTFADQEQPDLYLTQPSLMNMMKQAGYKTFWVTNHQTMTERNTMLTNFSQQTDEQVYLNNSREQNARSYDGNLIEPFRKMLADPAERKFIIVHMLGTHMKYEYRYPSEFDRFNDRQGLANWVTEEQMPVINHYDNAVLYHDQVVANLIKSLSAVGGNAMMAYFADHGEDVFDSPGHTILGRNEGKPTAPMYTVPFFIWESADWRKRHPRNYAKLADRPYQTSHFIHTWADLAGIRFDGFDASKSLVNQAFRERPLWVGDPINPKGLADLRTSMSAKR